MPRAPVAAAPRELYAAAVADAARAEPAERSSRLWAITPSSPRLRWDHSAGRSRVLVVTWTDWPGYDAHVGDAVPRGREVWVTAVPELREACRAFGAAPEGLSTRLHRYLGLHPDAPKDRFVELWVEPGDLFRPCPDPEVDDTSCELELPATVSPAHREWYARLSAVSYGASGYPWTRLGYTYDWSRAHGVGASEFVVRAGATVRVHAVTRTEAYCGS